jgi:hypothetical protein
MLIPALAKAKHKAQQTQCLNNLKQISLANSMQITDDNWMAVYGPWPRLWMADLLVKYRIVEKVRICPTAREWSYNEIVKERTMGGRFWGTVHKSWVCDNGGTNYFQGGYAINGYFYDQKTDPYGVPANHFTTEASVQNPTLTGMFCDSYWVDFWADANDRPARDLEAQSDAPNGGMSRIAIPRHAAGLGKNTKNFDIRNRLPGANPVAFADGHIESIRLDDLWMKVVWHRNWVAPAKRPGL